MKATGTIRWGGLLLIAGLAALASGCGKPAESQVHSEATMVLVSKPLQEQVPEDFLEVSGWTEASQSVNLRARVPGYLQSFLFEPGSEVQKGQLLFQIDPRPYEATLEQAQASVLSYEASVKRNAADLERSEKLLPSGAVSKEEFDQNVARKAESEAGLVGAMAKVDAAKLDVEFTKITAPCSGTIGRNLIDVGNLVAADVTELANIVAVDPIFVYFDLDEATALKIQNLLLEGKIEASTDHTFPVGVQLVGETGFPHEAEVDFIDNRLDPNTGTIRMRATLKNPIVAHERRKFASGLHVTVRVPIGMPYEALLVTDRAILSQQGQKFVYVVGAENKVVARNVRLGAVKNGMRVIEAGLGPAEDVIIDGLQFVRPGVSVTPQAAEMRPKSAASSDKATPAVTIAKPAQPPAAPAEATK